MIRVTVHIGHDLRDFDHPTGTRFEVDEDGDVTVYDDTGEAVAVYVNRVAASFSVLRVVNVTRDTATGAPTPVTPGADGRPRWT